MQNLTNILNEYESNFDKWFGFLRTHIFTLSYSECKTSLISLYTNIINNDVNTLTCNLSDLQYKIHNRYKFNYCKRITAAFSNAISRNTVLQKVIMSGCSLKDKHIKLISKCKTIRVLDVYYNNIGNKGIRYISTMTNLEVLNIKHNNFCGKILQELDNLTNLRELHVNMKDISNIIFGDKLQAETLIIGNYYNSTTVDHHLLHHVSKLPLNKLTIENTFAFNTNNPLVKLNNTLTELNINIVGTKCEFEHISKLINLKRLSLFHDLHNRIKLEDISFPPLNITHLHMSWAITGLVNNIHIFASLTHLTIKDGVTDTLLLQICQIQSLTYLNVYESFTNIGIEYISRLTNLTHLYIHARNVYDITPLIKLHKLTNLSLRCREINNIKILYQMNLEVLAYYPYNILNSEIEYLITLPTLFELYYPLSINHNNKNVIQLSDYNYILQNINNIQHPTLIRNTHNNIIRNTPFYDLLL